MNWGRCRVTGSSDRVALCPFVCLITPVVQQRRKRADTQMTDRLLLKRKVVMMMASSLG